MKIAVDEIKINPGRRETSLSGIDELTRSISEVGLLNPITVAPDYTLIAGLHRLEAVKHLGWAEIECTIYSLDGLQAKLAEIDENVVRTALSAIEYGELLEHRKEIYESIHPETKAGLSQAAGMNRAVGKHVSDKMSPTSKSFAQDTAEKLGVSVRTVQRTMQTMKDLTAEAKDIFRRYPSYKLSQNNAAKLSRLEPKKQKTAAILLVSGQIKSVDEYEPEQLEGKAPRRPKQDKEFLESVASLKDPTKGNVVDSELLLSGYRAMIQEVQKQINFYQDPHFKKAASSLSQAEMDELEQLTESCCELMRDYVRQMKETVTHPRG